MKRTSRKARAAIGRRDRCLGDRLGGVRQRRRRPSTADRRMLPARRRRRRTRWPPTARSVPACSAVPADGAGSFDGMAQDPVATAASNNPVLSTLVTAVTKARLVDTLNSAEDITVFAPTNDAFAAMDQKTLNTAWPTQGSAHQGAHLPRGPRSAHPVGAGGTHETLEGETLEVPAAVRPSP